MKNRSVVKVRNLGKSYDQKHLFEDLSFDIEPGKMVAITGPSGAGKSTLMNIIGLLEPADRGSVEIAGELIPRPSTAAASRMIRRHISYLFQNYALMEEKSVAENLKLALKYEKGPKKDKEQKIAQALDKVGLSGMENRKVCSLSGGEQQRVAIARAMLKGGQLLLADEPTGAVDPKNREILLQLLRQMAQDGRSVVIVTHDPAVWSVCDQVIELAPEEGLQDPE